MSIKDRYAAIDVGSNAIRMVISDYTKLGFKTVNKVRFPIRLGQDVFENGLLSQCTLDATEKIFIEFAQLCEEYHVEKIKAVATSAIREAKNQAAFLGSIQNTSGITVDVIDGQQEAMLIHLAVKNEVPMDQKNCILIDIGGGSVELTQSQNGTMLESESFPFGTVRTLENLRKRNLQESDLDKLLTEYSLEFSKFFKKQRQVKAFDFAIGTGGNAKALVDLKTQILSISSGKSLSLDELELIIKNLRSLSLIERSQQFNLSADRADVIIPASLIIKSIMHLADVRQLLIPNVGLKEGVLWSLV